ncbi:MAG: heavy-metal-associated domain-containing protein [Flavobacterium sp.]|nr:heavy-metal-associated domain-containing protein [Flavobacterium sp.]
MKNLKYKFITIIVILTSAVSTAQISKAEIKATGLTCSMCSNAINKQLKSMPEVANVDTDLNTNTFTVTLKTDNTLSPKIFKEKVEKAGFFIGSLIVSMKSEALNSKDYIFVNNKTEAATSEVKIQVLDKGYVTDKEYKKLVKSFKNIASYAVMNEDDFHVKMIK